MDAGEAAGLAAWLAATSDADGLWPAQAVANHTLAGVGAIDTVTAMAMMPLFDGVRWDDGLCARLGFDAARLPALSPGTAAIGEVDGVPLNGGTVDVFAEQLVADAREPGDVLVLCGTTLIPWALTTGWPEVEGLWTVPYTLPGLTAVGGASNAGGLFVDSVRRLLGPVDDGELDGLVPGEVPVWLPYLRGERTPLHDPDRRGELVGLALGQGPAAVLRAAYEATAFVVRHHVELSGVPARRIVAVGGGTRCAPWMQALADGTGLPVDVSAVPEGAALGAAFLARVTAGLEPDTSGAIAWSRLGRPVEPGHRGSRRAKAATGPSSSAPDPDRRPAAPVLLRGGIVATGGLAVWRCRTNAAVDWPFLRSLARRLRRTAGLIRQGVAMTLVREIADTTALLGEVVRNTRELLKAVNDGQAYLASKHPDAAKDFGKLLGQMQLAVEGLAEVTKVVSNFRFEIGEKGGARRRCSLQRLRDRTRHRGQRPAGSHTRTEGRLRTGPHDP